MTFWQELASIEISFLPFFFLMSLPRLTSTLAAFSLLFTGSALLPVIAHADNLGLVSLINQYRTGQGLGTLADDQKLTNAACWMGGDMAAHTYFSHTDSLNRDSFKRMDAFGAIGNARAENIASLTNQANSGQKIFSLWRNSPGHNANMLGPYSRIGVGFGYNSANKTYYWAADFASGTTRSLTLACGAAVPPPPPNPKPIPKPISKPSPTTPPVAQPVANPPAVPTKVLGEVVSSSSSAKIASTSPTNSTEPDLLVKNSFGLKPFLIGIIFLVNLSLLSYLVFLLWKNHKRTKFD